MQTEVIIKSISLINSIISLLKVSKDYRETIAQAILEGRDITEQELDDAEAAAQKAIDNALKD